MSNAVAISAKNIGVDTRAMLYRDPIAEQMSA
jgi:hypothetical protein